MSMTDEERKAIVDYRVEKANGALDEARKLYDLEMYNLAANRLYYALYYASTALLISQSYSSRTHAGMLTLMNQHFVKTGTLEPTEGKLLRTMYNLRQEGDYEDFQEVDQSDIETFTPLVKALVEKIIRLI